MVIIAKWLLTLDLTSVSRRVGLVYSRLRKEEPEGSRPLKPPAAMSSVKCGEALRQVFFLKAVFVFLPFRL